MAENERLPSFDATLPADVRYHETLSANAKLLYAEIRALTDKCGYCFAGNPYFCRVFGFSDRTVTRLIGELEENHFLLRIIDKDKTGQVVQRKLFLCMSSTGAQPPDKIVTPTRQNLREGGDKNGGDNEIRIIDKKESKKKKSEELSLEDMRPLVTEWVTSISPDSWSHEILDILESKILEFYGDREKRPRRTALGFKNFGALLLLYSGGNYRVMMEMMCKSIMSGWTGLVDPRPKQITRPVAQQTGEEDIPEL